MLSVVETSVYQMNRFFDKLRMTSNLDFSDNLINLFRQFPEPFFPANIKIIDLKTLFLGLTKNKDRHQCLKKFLTPT